MHFLFLQGHLALLRVPDRKVGTNSDRRVSVAQLGYEGRSCRSNGLGHDKVLKALGTTGLQPLRALIGIWHIQVVLVMSTAETRCLEKPRNGPSALPKLAESEE